MHNYMCSLKGEQPIFKCSSEDLAAKVRKEWESDGYLVFFEGAEDVEWTGPIGGSFERMVDASIASLLLFAQMGECCGCKEEAKAWTWKGRGDCLICDVRKGIRRSDERIDSDLARNVERGAIIIGKKGMRVPRGRMGDLKGDIPHGGAVLCAYADLLRKFFVGLFKKPWWIGELCQVHPLFTAIGLQSAALREAVRLLDPYRREELRRNFPPSLMALVL